MPVAVKARGLTRVSAISGAHLEALRRAGLSTPGPARVTESELGSDFVDFGFQILGSQITEQESEI